MPLSSVDYVVASPGSGGAALVCDVYVDPGDGITKTLPYSGICIGTQNGTYELVGAAASLPVEVTSAVQITDGGNSITVDGSISALQSGTWLADLRDGSGNAIESAIATPGSATRGLIVRTAGGVDQGSPATAANAWPAKISDGVDSATLTTVDTKVGVDVNVIGGVGGSSIADKAVFTPGSDLLTMAGGTYRVSRDNVGDGRSGAFSMTALRALYATLETATGDTVIDDTIDSVRVMIVDGAGSQITSFGGGIEYAEGAADSSITGKAILWEDTSDVLRVPSAAHPLPVEIISSSAGGTAMVDDAAFTFGTTSITPAGGVYNSSRDNLDSGDGGAIALTQKRGQYVVVETPAGDSVAIEGINALQVAIVDSLGAHIETFGGGSQYAEDSAHVSGDTGTMSLAVRRDANTSLVGTDGDYAPLQVDATGSLKVSIISGAGSGGTAMTDDAAFTPAVTSITPAGGTYRATRDSVDDGDGGAIAITAKRGVYTSPETVTGDPVTNDTLNSVVGSSAFPAAVTGVVSGTGTSTALDTSELGTVAVTLSGTASVITALFQVSNDGGTTWINVLGKKTTTGLFETGPVGIALVGTGVSWQVSVAGYNRFRINFTAVSYTSLSYSIQGISETFPGEGLSGARLDDAAFTFGSDYVMAAGGVYNSSRDSLDSGDAGAIALNVKRGVFTTLEDSSGNPVVASTADPAAGNLSLAVKLTPPTSNSVAYPMKVTDGTTVATVRELGTNDALNVAICDASGNQLAQILNSEFAQSAVHGSSDKGIMAYVVRRDANTSMVASDGMVAPLQVDATGNLKVNVVTSSSSSAIDDSGFTVGASGVTPAAGVYLTSRDSLDNGDTGAFAMTLKRAQFVCLENSSAVEISVTDNAAFTDGTTPLTPAGFIFDEVAGTALTENDAAAARVDSKRAQVLVLEDATTRGQRLAISAAGAMSATETQVLADNAAFTDGTTKVFANGYVFDEVAGTALTENDIAAARIDSKRAQVLVIEDATTRGRRMSVSSNGEMSSSVAGKGILCLSTTVTATGTVSLTTSGFSSNNFQCSEYVVELSSTGGNVDTVVFEFKQGGASNLKSPIYDELIGASANSVRLTNGLVSGIIRRFLVSVMASDASVPEIDITSLTLGSATNLAIRVYALGQPVTRTKPATKFTRIISAASTNITTIRSGAVVLDGYCISNNTTSLRYVKFYDKAGGLPTIGTDTPVLVVMIPKESTVQVTGLEKILTDVACFATTTGIADSDTAAVGANELSVNIFYR